MKRQKCFDPPIPSLPYAASTTHRCTADIGREIGIDLSLCPICVCGQCSAFDGEFMYVAKKDTRNKSTPRAHRPPSDHHPPTF